MAKKEKVRFEILGKEEEITIKESVDDDLEDLSNEMETREDVDLSNLPYKGGVEEEKDNLYDDYDEDAEEEDFEIDLDIDDLIKNETQEEEEEEEDY